MIERVEKNYLSETVSINIRPRYLSLDTDPGYPYSYSHEDYEQRQDHERAKERLEKQRLHAEQKWDDLVVHAKARLRRKLRETQARKATGLSGKSSLVGRRAWLGDSPACFTLDEIISIQAHRIRNSLHP